MLIQEKLATLSFIEKESLSMAVSVTDQAIVFKFPIQHHLKTLSALKLPIKQDIPVFEAKNPPHPHVKNIIAIASGKGGVGKSTVTYYLAQALSHMGAKVGVLDADIYGPSQGLLFNLDTEPKLNDNKQFIPYLRSNIEVMSIGVLSSSQKALMWRGPMISQALLQLYNQTQWSELDYLLIDLPPGTGDIPLTLIQKMPLTAALLVSHPHPLAKLDVEKCQGLFAHLNIPILETVVNQSPIQCPNCHTELSNLQPQGYAIPYRQDFNNMKAFAYPEFISLAERITQKLTQFGVRTLDPFDRISITQTEK